MKKITLALTLLLGGCSATGPEYHDQHANLVVYRLDRTAGFASDIDIEANGLALCDLSSGGFVATNRFNGVVTLTASQWEMPGTTRLTVTTPSYVRATYDPSMGFALAGFVGALAEQAASSHSGPFQFESVAPEIAKKELQGLKQQCT